MPKGMADKKSAGDLALGLFTEGKAGMIVGGTWNIPPIVKAGINYGVVQMPKLPNGHVIANYSGFNGLALSGFSKKADLAIPYMEYLVSPELSSKYYEMTGRIPVTKEFLQSHAETDPLMKVFNEQIKYSVPMIKIVEGNQTWDPMHAALGALAAGENPKAVMDKAVEQVKNNIAAIKK
jgi:arabinogalactan oligomer/maltooligosaccharide transport system substrate-binding protein